MKLASASIVFFLLLAAEASAAVTNGTFDSPLAPSWDSTTDGAASTAIQSFYGTATNVLHMSAATNYAWNPADGGSWYATETIAYGDLEQYNASVPAGATALTFDASAFCTGASLVGSLYGTNPSALVSIVYLQGGLPVQASRSVAIGSSDSGILTNYSIPISPDADSLASISITVTTQIDLNERNPNGLPTTEVAVDAWFDNINFVPEPATMAILAFGLPLILRCRRK